MGFAVVSFDGSLALCELAVARIMGRLGASCL